MNFQIVARSLFVNQNQVSILIYEKEGKTIKQYQIDITKWMQIAKGLMSYIKLVAYLILNTKANGYGRKQFVIFHF